MWRCWLGCALGVLLCTVSLGDADERRSSPLSADEHWEGYRTWRPDRDRRWRGRELPDRFTIERPGKCEVRCERSGRSYRCKEYRC
jgi:hypothetical protein